MQRTDLFRTLALTTVFAVMAFAGCFGHVDDAPAQGGSFTVDMKDVKFSPATLTVPMGATVTWTNNDPFGHTVTPVDPGLWGTEGSGDDPADWIQAGQEWSFTFTKEGTFDYYCLPHSALVEGVWQGMIGTVIVDASAGGPTLEAAPASPLPAKAVDVAEIGRDASDVPAPVGGRGPEHLTFDITSYELVAEMADGTTYTYWTFDRTVPGPMLRARIGDTITVNLHNDASSTMGHNIDLHAVTGPGGGAGILNAAPGETATLTFEALNAGLFIYHCAYQDPPLHIAHGMYGLILIEPEGGLAPVDKEFYVVQGDFYSTFRADRPGHHEYDGDMAWAETPSFVVFNGRMGSLKDADRQLQAEVGDTVRMFVGNGGPNLVSSFHIIGEIFDRSYDQGGITNAPQEGIQTTLVPAGGAAMVEFDLEVPGDYFLVDHSIHRIHKGAFGILHVSGDDRPDVYRSGE